MPGSASQSLHLYAACHFGAGPGSAKNVTSYNGKGMPKN